MIAGFASLIITLGIIVLVIRRIAVGRRGGVDFADEVKDFFQYLLLLILILIVNSGLSGLIGYVSDSGKRLIANEDLLARDSAFVVVATPLLVAVAFWTHRTLERDEQSRESFALLLYLALIQVIAFANFATSAYRWILEIADGGSIITNDSGSAIIWLSTLFFHYGMSKNRLSESRIQLPFLLLSGISLVVGIFGIARIIRGLMVEFLPFAETIVSTSAGDEITRGLILCLIAIPTWYSFWIIDQARTSTSQLWNIYLLIVGVGASLVAVITSISIAFYDTLVWFFGDANTNASWIHFDRIPGATGALIATILAFSYHSRILGQHHDSEEGEIGRIYRYLLSAIGLGTSAIGGVTLVVSLVESFIKDDLLVGRSPRNALLLAITLFLAGLPLWQLTWKRINDRIASDRSVELNSIARKVYLFTVVGVSAIAAVVSILTITVQIFQGLFGGDIGGGTVREISYAISIFAVGMIGGLTHLRIIQKERAESRPRTRSHKSLLLIGPADRSLARELERSTGARVEIVESLDGFDTTWDREKVLALLRENQKPELALIAESGEIKAIPIKR
ncbi:MAG: DUF5671 domain-containing protein [Candidatus Nanopelagicaceae bacterium]